MVSFESKKNHYTSSNRALKCKKYGRVLTRPWLVQKGKWYSNNTYIQRKYNQKEF